MLAVTAAGSCTHSCSVPRSPAPLLTPTPHITGCALVLVSRTAWAPLCSRLAHDASGWGLFTHSPSATLVFPHKKCTKQTTLQVARWCFENGMGTIMLQAGELPNPSRLAYLQEIVTRVVEETVAMDLERRGLDPKVRAHNSLSWCFVFCAAQKHKG